MVKGQDLGWGMGARERAQGWALSFILMPYPSSLSLTLGQSQVNTFCFSGKKDLKYCTTIFCGCAILG